MRVRSRWFILSGALGGLVGFLLMETFSVPVPGAGAGTFTGDILRMSFYFAGFGLAVGIALGMTEGVVQRRPGRAIYGFIMGLILGAAGGFAGGALGQTIYSLVPRTRIRDSTSDLAIVLDSSNSMRSFFFWGHDPWGQRKSAAKNLIDRLSPTDRVAIVDFDDTGRVVLPLSFLGSETARTTAKSAVNQIDNWGGTNLSAGIDTAVGELAVHKKPGRRQFIIFLTDGQGEYTPESAARAGRDDITVYTVGLGDEVEADLLQSIAVATGGKYYPVSDASELVALFERIFREHVGAMNEVPQEVDPLLLLGLRTLSWALMGLLIGLGQGIRENTREDLWACAFGGLLGGALGGALFDPVVNLLTAGNGLVGRALADVVVGACIGGSMRLVQEKIVEASGKPGTVLIPVLPKKASVTFRPSPASPPPPRPAPVPVPPQPSWTSPSPSPAPIPPPVPAPVTPAVRPEPIRAASTTAPAANRPPLPSFEGGNDRETAMVLARRAGYGLGEIGQHFGVPATTVKRILSEKGV